MKEYKDMLEEITGDPINDGSWTDIGNWDEYINYIHLTVK